MAVGFEGSTVSFELISKGLVDEVSSPLTVTFCSELVALSADCGIFEGGA